MSLRELRLFVEENEDDPDAIDVWMDGEVIMTLSYDRVGYTGQEAVKNLIEIISRQM